MGSGLLQNNKKQLWLLFYLNHEGPLLAVCCCLTGAS